MRGEKDSRGASKFFRKEKMRGEKDSRGAGKLFRKEKMMTGFVQ